MERKFFDEYRAVLLAFVLVIGFTLWVMTRPVDPKPKPIDTLSTTTTIPISDRPLLECRTLLPEVLKHCWDA